MTELDSGGPGKDIVTQVTIRNARSVAEIGKNGGIGGGGRLWRVCERGK